MPKPFKGVVNVDIRDSVPDWEPFLAAQGARGRAERADHRLGRRRLRHDGRLRRPGRDADDAAHRRRGRALLQLPHDRAVLADTRSACSPAATPRATAWPRIAEFSSGFPGISDPDPVRERLHLRGAAERGYNTYCVGKWHLTPGRGEQHGGVEGPLAARPRVRAVLRLPRRRDEPVVSRTSSTTTTTIEPPATPEEGYHLVEGPGRQGDRVHPRRQGRRRPTSRSSCTSRPGCAHAPHHVFKEWADRYKGRFDEGYEAIRATILAHQKELGLLPDDTELSPINPHGEPDATGPDGQPWPLLDTVRPWDSLSDDEKRLFARMAEVFAGLRLLHRRPDRRGCIDYLEESGQLDNTIIVVVSDNGASGEGGPNGSFNEWRVLQRRRRHRPRRTCEHIDELGSPTSYNHYNTGWAWAFDTPFPYWKRWAGYEGGVADMCLVVLAGEDRRARRGAPPVRPRRRRRPDDLRPARHRAAGRAQGLPRRARSRARASRPRSPTRRAAEARPSSTRCSGSARSTTRAGSPAPLHPPISRLGQVRPGRVGALPPRTRTAPSRRTSPPSSPERLERAQGPVVRTTPGIYNGLPLDDRTALEQIISDERPQPSAPRDRYVYYPGRGRGARVGVGQRSAAARTRSPRRWTLDDAEAEGVLFAQGGVAGGHAST